MAAGAVIGGVNGFLSRLTDAAFPFNWILLSEIKKIMAQAIIVDAHRDGETIDAELLNNSAWLTSWLTYLAVFPKIVIKHEYIGPVFVISSTSISY